jgi:hypothetical protein
MARYYVTVGPESRDDHPSAGSPTWVVEAADEGAARDRAEVAYRRRYPEVRYLRLRLTRARSRPSAPASA